MMSGHIGTGEADHEYLDDFETSIWEGIENDEQRDAYKKSRFNIKSLARRKLEAKVRQDRRSLSTGWSKCLNQHPSLPARPQVNYLLTAAALHLPILVFLVLPLMLVGVSPAALVGSTIQIVTTDFPGRVVFLWFFGLRSSASLFLWNCHRQMKKKFRTRSSFDLRFQQEIKYILFGNVGEFDKFRQEDKSVIKEYTEKFYESEVIIKGLPFHSYCPMVEKSHHHHGIKSHNEEVRRASTTSED